MIEDLVTRDDIENSDWKFIHWMGSINEVYVVIDKIYMEVAVVVGSILIKIEDPVISSYEEKEHVVERNVKRKVEEFVKEDWFKERYDMETAL